jgi:methionyl-tRNA formyltransferase
MSTALDAGDMLAQEAIDIGPDETAGDVEARLAPLGARLALQVIDQMEAGTVQGQKQDPALVTKAPKLTKERGAIDWTRHGKDVCNHVRAMHPWPTPYTFWHRTGHEPLRLIVHRARWRPAEAGEHLSAGEVLVPSGALAHLCVGAGGQTVVEVHELQPAGKRRMSAEEFLRGHHPQPGDRLGPERQP